MSQLRNRCVSKGGFSLVEIMVASAILLFTFAGILLCFFRCMELHEMSRNSSNSVAAVKSRMETIRNTQFSNLSNFHNITFTTPAVNGIGVSYVDTTDPDLYEIRVVFCWIQKNGRVIGEDLDLDGQIDAGEDVNGNGFLDSPVQIVTSVYDI